MKVVFVHILNLLFPPSEDELILQKTSPALFCKKYILRTCKGSIVLASFKDKEVRAAIHLNKFHKHETAGTLLAQLLEQYLIQLPQGPYILIPIPLPKARERKRGYNQVCNILEKLHLPTDHFVVAPDILYRIKNTKPQTTLSKEARVKNLNGAFMVPKHKADSLGNAQVLLIDDVTTTGTTLKEARKVLMEYHPKRVTCIALCN